MDRRLFAVVIVGLALVIGFVGSVFFYNQYIGLSFLLFILVVLITLIGLSLFSPDRLRMRNLWLVAPIVFFSGMIAILANPMLIMLNSCAVLVLTCLMIRYLADERNVDSISIFDQIEGSVSALFGIFSSPGMELSDTANWLKSRDWREWGSVSAVGRGLLITIPILFVFALFLGSADAVFGTYLEQALSAIIPNNVSGLLGRLFITSALGWFVTGLFSFGLARRTQPQDIDNGILLSLSEEPINSSSQQSDDILELQIDASADGELTDDVQINQQIVDDHPEDSKNKRVFQLGFIETSILLVGLNLLFGVFVLVQFAYLFGGQSNIRIDGFTYAEYARRGFFELLAVTIMTLGLALWLDSHSLRTESVHHKIFRGLNLGIVLLLIVILISASRRMSLYETAYGFTHLRVLTHIFMGWLGVLLIAFLLSVFQLKEHVFSLGILLVAIGYIATLNVINVDLYIANQNIDRYLDDGHELDICYLNQLSLDAVPAMIRLRTVIDDSELSVGIDHILAQHLTELADMQNGTTLFEYNLVRDEIWQSLNEIRDELPSPLSRTITQQCIF